MNRLSSKVMISAGAMLAVVGAASSVMAVAVDYTNVVLWNRAG